MRAAWESLRERVERLRCTECDNLEMLVIQKPVARKVNKQLRVVAKCPKCGGVERINRGPRN
jgi:RNase P subunit RPR2